MEADERILAIAKDLYWKYGIKSITMDDIGKEIGMSKKTIYQYFPDKDEVVLQVIKKELESNKKVCNAIIAKSENAVHEVVLMMELMGGMISEVNIKLFFDLQKYHPEAWKLYKEFKEKYALKCIEDNLNKGIKEGLYRPEINVKIIARLRSYQIEMAYNASIFPTDKFSILDIQLQMMEHFLIGISTVKGHRMINKYKALNDDE